MNITPSLYLYTIVHLVCSCLVALAVGGLRESLKHSRPPVPLRWPFVLSSLLTIVLGPVSVIAVLIYFLILIRQSRAAWKEIEEDLEIKD